MNPSAYANAFLQQAIDLFFRFWPRPTPPISCLKSCKIISHRGEFDNRGIFENSIAAFGKAESLGAWGIEFDIRWTRDLQPVVFHDRSLIRLFGSPRRISHMTWSEIQQHYPSIPLLSEVVERYGGRLHLMIEIKSEEYPDPARQSALLKSLLEGLASGADYHMLSLHPEMFHLIDFASLKSCLPIAEFNIRRLSDLALNSGYCGITGHYLMVTASCLARHKQAGQQVGTGFVCSKNSLYRELNRGIEWVFTNQAGKLLQIIQAAASGKMHPAR